MIIQSKKAFLFVFSHFFTFFFFLIRSLETRADYIHLVQMPNLYRGIHRVPDPNTATPTELQSIAGLYAGRHFLAFFISSG
jgi:hypothetical protein